MAHGLGIRSMEQTLLGPPMAECRMPGEAGLEGPVPSIYYTANCQVPHVEPSCIYIRYQNILGIRRR